MSEKEIKKLDKKAEEKVSGGFDLNFQKKAKPVKCGKSVLDSLISVPAPYYGAPAIKPIKPELTDKPVITEKPEQSVDPLVPVKPVKEDDSEILK